MKLELKRRLLILCGFLSLILGIIGAFLPILPTTPLVILAAFCFSKSSPKLHFWLTSNKYFGDAIIDWERHHVIRPKAKKMATFAIVLVFGASLIFGRLALGLKLMLIAIAIGVLIFIWTRKSEA